jgi:hypothetical protein
MTAANIQAMADVFKVMLLVVDWIMPIMPDWHTDEATAGN